jgi:hypothetical protein
MTNDDLKARLFVAAAAVATTGLAVYALAAPLHHSD